MTTSLNVSGTVGKAIAEYTGTTPRQIEICPDPIVEGTYAVRAWFTNHEVDFLIVQVPLHKVTADDLEETEFETWPPKSTGRVTGWMVS